MFSLNKAFLIFSRGQKKYLLFIFVMALISMLLESLSIGVILPLFSILLKGDVGAGYFSTLFQLIDIEGKSLIYVGLFVTLIIFLIKNLFLIFNHWCLLNFLEKIFKELTNTIFKHYIKQDYIFLLQRNTAELIRNVRSEVNSFNQYINMYMVLVSEILITIGIVIVLFYVDFLGTVIVLSCVSGFGLIIFLISKKKINILGKNRIIFDGQINKHVYQGLFAAKDVKILDRENDLIEQVSQNVYELSRINQIFQFIAGLPKFLFEVLIVLVFMTLVIFMVSINREMIDIIQYLGVFAIASFRIVPAAIRVSTALQQVKYRQPTVNLLAEELNLNVDSLKYDNAKSTNSKISKKFSNKINLSNLNFSYPSRKEFSLSEISMTIKKGDFIGIVGQTGSGKSTLINLFIGLLKPKSGKIEVDEFDIFTGLSEWHRKIGYVPQSIYLTDDTIKKNIAFGLKETDIDDNLVNQAVEKANLNELLKNLPNGIETFVGEKGIRISGGQLQRIGIARALYRNPEILVLDEATSSLDFITEKKIMDSIQLLKREKTLIIVTHRLSSVENCDRVFFIDKGKIEKEGSPQEVLKYLK